VNVVLVILLVTAIAVLIIALLLDILIGDPSPNDPDKLVFKSHPTVLMGKLTKALEPHFKSSDPGRTKIGGVFLALIVILAFAIPVFLGLWALYMFLGILVYAIFAVILLKLTICIKLETDWAKSATKALENNDLIEAKKYSHFSRRDSRDLAGAQISSAVIESMAENLIDFKLSPIIAYSLFGVVGATVFRAINTLDGMVGFKDPEHLEIGWFSANLDTVINYVPARLTAILIIIAAALTGHDARTGWAIARRDHGKTPSRNHGWPMAAMAGALRVQLEKPGQYILGEPTEQLTPDKIIHAVRIRDASIVLCVLLCLPIIFLTRLLFFPF
jgi:adenosylcobinamide-phosphate synthase